MAKKNLIFLFADQWRGSAIGYAEDDPVITPNMDAFCEESTYCTNVFSSFPLCSPHRASLMTGKYPLSAGFFTNCKNSIPLRLKDKEIGIGEVLKEGGYQTAYIGKWHLDEPEINHSPHPQSGARDWDAFTPPGPRRHGFDYWYSYGAWDDHLDPHYWHDTSKMNKVHQWSVEHETDKAIEYLKEIRNAEDPFALYVSWNPPHSPYDQVPKKYFGLYKDKELSFRKNVKLDHIHHHTGEQTDFTAEDLMKATKQYYAAISGIDDNFGRLIHLLKDNGLYDDTIIVLSSDHGDMMGSQGLMGKHVWYEEAIKIPFVIRVPGNEKKKCLTCMESPDMMPTLLRLLNLPIPETVEGVDCSEYLVTEKEDLAKASFLCACPGRDIFIKKFKEHNLNPESFGWRGIRTQSFTYVMELGYDVFPRKKCYLYHTSEDKYQMDTLDLNLEKNRQISKYLEEMVIDWMERQNDGFLEIWKRVHKN